LPCERSQEKTFRILSRGRLKCDLLSEHDGGREKRDAAADSDPVRTYEPEPTLWLGDPNEFNYVALQATDSSADTAEDPKHFSPQTPS
jgi:hypothetical protein